jgi:hypothetical protein
MKNRPVPFCPDIKRELARQVGNASALALQDAQKSFSDVAENLGNPTEEDIQSWVDDVRNGKGKSV